MSKQSEFRRALASAVATLAATALFAPGDATAVDAAAAQTLARQNNCFKCHAIDKKKEGPAWKEVAAKYKGKPGAEEKLYKHLISGEKAKFPDGHEEDHPIVKTKSPDDTKNLVSWILSLD